jgi:sortase A
VSTDWRAPTRRVGIVLVIIGAFVAGFIAYELALTGFIEHAAQRSMVNQITTTLPATLGPTTTAEGKVPTGSVQPGPHDAPALDGAWIGTVQIPKISLVQVIVEGTSFDDLTKGPGHYSGTASLGSVGNSAIAGHRTTWGAPFRRLNELRLGDDIIVTNSRASYLYRVSSIQVVAPTATRVLAPSATPTLTLTTCNPVYSATSRLVIGAQMFATTTFPINPSHPDPITGSGSARAGGARGSWWTIVLDATLLALVIGLGWRWRSRSAKPRIVAVFMIVMIIPLTLSLYYSLAWRLPSSL